MSKGKERDKKEIFIYEIFSLIFMVIGFISVFLGVLLDIRQPDKNWITYGIIIFLAFQGIGLFLRNLVKEDKVLIRVKKRQSLYETIDLTEVDFGSLDELKKGVESNGYELLSNGYYYKRSAAQGVCYYSKFIVAKQLKDIIEKEMMRFKKFYTENCKKINGIIFFSMPEVYAEDKAYVKEVSKDMVLAEEALGSNQQLSIVIVLIDESKNKGYYFDVPESYHSRVYTYGCLVLRKIFKK